MDVKSLDFNLEICEVLNAFPILEQSLQDLEIDTKNIKEGESFKNFLDKVVNNKEEREILLRKLNKELNYYFKNGKRPEINISNNSDEFISFEN